MDCSSHYSESVDHDDRTKIKLAHFHRMSNDEPLDKAVEPSITPAFHRSFLNCFAFLRPWKSRKLNAEQARRQDLERRTPTPSIIPALSFAKMGSQVNAAPYAWPITCGMNPETTALVIIDMQKDCEYYLIFLLCWFWWFPKWRCTTHFPRATPEVWKFLDC